MPNLPEASEPYLSVVVTARNDDHGGNLRGRMQTFAYKGVADVRVGAPFPVRVLLRFYCGHGGITGLLLGKRKPPMALYVDREDSPVPLHTNGDWPIAICRKPACGLQGMPLSSPACEGRNIRQRAWRA